MKKIIISFFCALSVAGLCQEDKTFRLGVQWGAHGNRSHFEDGMSDANARFNQNKFGGGALGLIARYDFNHRWMAMSGIGLNSYGFEFALAENYSLLQKGKRFSTIKSEFGSLEIPAMLYYKFNPNCKNARWLVGGGLVETFIGAQTMDKYVSNTPDGGTNANYLSSSTSVKGGTYFMVRLSIAREKIFRCGSIFNASLVFNAGFKDIAHSTVNYTVDSQNYTHSFSNNGNFAGFRLAYFFRPLNKGGQQSQSKKQVKMD